MQADAWFTVSDVARRFECSADTVRYWDRTGRLPAERTSSGVRLYSESALRKFEAEREERQKPTSSSASAA